MAFRILPMRLLGVRAIFQLHASFTTKQSFFWELVPAERSILLHQEYLRSALPSYKTFADTHKDNTATTRYMPYRQSIAGIFITMGHGSV